MVSSEALSVNGSADLSSALGIHLSRNAAELQIINTGFYTALPGNDQCRVTSSRFCAAVAILHSILSILIQLAPTPKRMLQSSNAEVSNTAGVCLFQSHLSLSIPIRRNQGNISDLSGFRNLMRGNAGENCKSRKSMVNQSVSVYNPAIQQNLVSVFF